MGLIRLAADSIINFFHIYCTMYIYCEGGKEEIVPLIQEELYYDINLVYLYDSSLTHNIIRVVSRIHVRVCPWRGGRGQKEKETSNDIE